MSNPTSNLTIEYNCFDWLASTFSEAAQILSKALGSPAILGQCEALWDAPDNCKRNVLRCEVFADREAAPKTVILKRIASPRVTYNPDDMQPHTIAWRHGTELAACRLLNAAEGGSGLYPRCYGGYRNDALLVLQDLGTGPTVASILMGYDPVLAEKALIAYADTLGRMHAATYGREREYDQIRGDLRLPMITARQDDMVHVREHVATYQKIIASFGCSVTPASEKEMDGVLRSLADPGPFLVLTHGDPNPVNDIYTGGRARLYDFEYGGFRHALMDGVFNRHLYHWVLCSLPDGVLSRMEARYRRELARACPEAENEDCYRLEQMRTRSVWLLVTLNSLLERVTEEDSYEEERRGNEGIIAPTLRQRALILLERFAADAKKYQCLPAIGKSATELGENLRGRWRIEPHVLPYYPAFSGNRR